MCAVSLVWWFEMSATGDASQALQQFLARYQRHVMTRTALASLLGLVCLSVLVVRLHGWGVGRFWLLGTGLAGLLALGLWQWQAFRRVWLSSRHALLELDRTLGLKERLVTATEFADIPKPPLLYPVLVQDTTVSLANTTKRLPRIADRWTFALVAVLLLLALWPSHAPIPQRLAMHLPTALLPTPPPPDQQPQEHLPASMPARPEESKAGGDEGQGGMLQDQQQASQDRQAGGTGAQGQRAAGHQADASSSDQTGRGARESSGTQGDSQPPRQTQHAQTEDQTQAGQTPSPHAAASQQRTGTQEQARESIAQARDRAGGTQADNTLSQTARGEGAGQLSSAQQDQLKQEIQQLLKQLSGELKQLQAQLTAKTRDQPSPLPGTATDPNLYDAQAALEQASGKPLPIQLEVDTQSTATTRPGGGVGQPSEQVMSATPQQEPEAAQLADTVAEEPPSQRRPIPPEYRPVFERLSRTGQHPE